MRIGFTGHRPDKLYGYDYQVESYGELYKAVDNWIKSNIPKIDHAVFGGALGFDQLAFELIKKYKVNMLLALPYPSFGENWYNNIHKDILESQKQHADTLIYISDNDNHYTRKLMKRNEYIVNNSDILIACWNGSSKGGTANTIRNALVKGIPVYRVNPMTFKFNKVTSVL